MTPMTPGHPSRNIRMIVIPVKANGNTSEAKKIGIFSSIMLKSLDNMLTTFEIYDELFSVNCERAESLAKRTATRPALSLAPMIGD